MMSKISGLLSDEESVRQISELAKMFRAGEFNEEPVHEEAAQADESLPDMEQMMKLISLAGTFSGQDKNTELLLALRPHLAEEKQLRLDRAVKMMKIIAVYNAAKESGLINNLF